MTNVLIILALIGVTYYLISSRSASKKTFREQSSWSRFQQQGLGSKRTLDRGRMVRCHNCGCFFPESHLVTRVIEGHRLQFCSKDCRDNFRYP